MTECAGLAAGPPAVDVVRLARLVRVRWVLRIASRLTLLALPAWLIVGQYEFVDEPALRTDVDDSVIHGAVVIAILLVVLGLLSVGTRLVPGVGAPAARLMPVHRPVPDPVFETDGGDARLLDLRSRPRNARASTRSKPERALLWIGALVLVVVTAIPGSMIPAEYRASRGEGGPVVTIGADSHITRTVEGAEDDVHYISSPTGEVVVDGSVRPVTGERYVIVDTGSGRRAVKVGGLAWVVSSVIVGVILLLVLAGVGLAWRHRAARGPDRRIVPLTVTLTSLARGDRVVVRPVSGRGHPVGPDTLLTVSRTGPRPTDVDAAEWVRRRLRFTTAVGVAVVTALVAVAALVIALG